jgi:hypothetical protein
MKITEKTFDILTNEETLSEREETKSEKEFRDRLRAEAEAIKIQNETNALAKAALLERLGITAEEAALLLG